MNHSLFTLSTFIYSLCCCLPAFLCCLNMNVLNQKKKTWSNLKYYPESCCNDRKYTTPFMNTSGPLTSLGFPISWCRCFYFVCFFPLILCLFTVSFVILMFLLWICSLSLSNERWQQPQISVAHTNNHWVQQKRFDGLVWFCVKVKRDITPLFIYAPFMFFLSLAAVKAYFCF